MACPAKTFVLGGGSLSNSGSVAVNINSTLPSGNGWRTDQNTNTSTATTFTVYAICGKKPKGYIATSGSSVTNPPSSQTLATATCASGSVPLSGGAFSSSGSPAVDLNSTLPSSNGWAAYEDNTAGAGTATITAYVICAG